MFPFTPCCCLCHWSLKQDAVRGAVSWARMSKAGAPLVRLSDSSVYLLHEGLACWLRLTGPSSPASAFSSLLDSATGGLHEGMPQLYQPSLPAVQGVAPTRVSCKAAGTGMALAAAGAGGAPHAPNQLLG